MPEPAALGRRRLWRTVVRPLVEEGEGDIVCDSSDATIVEGILATTKATLHAIRRNAALDALAEVYPNRIVFHREPGTAWDQAARCRLAIVDLARASSGHVDALIGLVQSEREAPPVLAQGVGGQEEHPALSAFKTHGWAVVELPGFEQIRLVLPSGRRILGGSIVDALLSGLRAGEPGEASHQDGNERAEKLEELSTRMRHLEGRVAEAEAGCELAERRRDASEEIVTTLRLLNDKAQGDLERAQRESDSLRRIVDSSRAELAAARAEGARLDRTQAALRQDLVRLQSSQAWRLGHWLIRAARVLTFRKPGHTDAVSKAINRIDAVRPPGQGHR